LVGEQPGNSQQLDLLEVGHHARDPLVDSGHDPGQSVRPSQPARYPRELRKDRPCVCDPNDRTAVVALWSRRRLSLRPS
jgi:hypothetical protein